MCTSKPRTPKPIASAPYVGPDIIDDTVIQERNRERQRQVARAGRASTILAGNTGVQPTASQKTALGS